MPDSDLSTNHRSGVNEVAETGIRNTVRQWYPLALIYLAIGLSAAMVAPFLTLFLTTAVRADPAHVTLYLVVAPLSSVVVSTLLGRWSDRRGSRRQLLIVAAIAGCASAALYSVVRDYWVLLILVATATASAGALIPQVFAYARTVMRRSGNAAMTISSLRTLFSVAWVGGPPLAAVVLTSGGFTAVFASAAAMYGIAALVAAFLLPKPASSAPERTADVRDPQQIRRRRTLPGGSSC